MTSLSLNWKKLSSKVGTKSNKKSNKVSKKKITKESIKNKDKKEAEIEKLIDEKLTNSINTDTDTEKLSLEHTLWAYDNEIGFDDLFKSVQVTLGNSLRKIKPGKYLAMDCEFVGVGPEGTESALARVSIVNFYGHVVLDEFVKPREKVTDWRTWVSGITPKHMNKAISFEEAQKRTSSLLENRILVGHAVHHDLESLFLSHPKSKLRDTTQYKPFRKISMGRTPSLKKLAAHFLKIDIQGGSHSSVEDARATMLLFRLHRKDFEQSLKLIAS